MSKNSKSKVGRPKGRRPTKRRQKKQTKLQRSLLKRVKKAVKQRRRDYAAEYKRRLQLARKREREAKKAAKKRSEAAKRGAATRKAKADARRLEAERVRADAAQSVRLTSSQVRVITNWYETKFNPFGYADKIPTLEELIEFAQGRGYQGFKDYRRMLDAARATYVKEVEQGTYESRGYGYLVELTTMAKVRPEGEEQWLYYH